jgi:ABC-type molybdate transport system substrate-binding protein
MSGVTVFCDPALAPAMQALAPLAAVKLAILCAPAPAMLAQIARHTRDDVLVTISTSMDQAAAQNFIDPKTRIDGFSNPLVLAGLAGGAKPSNARLRIAVTDDTVISGLDGAALLAANGFAPGDNRLVGTADTQDALFLLLNGAVDAAVVYRTDAKSSARVEIMRPLQADAALTAVSAALTAKAVSPNASALLNLMRAANGMAALSAAGLELAA